MKVIAMIPARYAATRFPYKLMQPLGSKTVIRHTYAKAGSYTVRANIKLNGIEVAECEATVRITSGSGAVLGASTSGNSSGNTAGSSTTQRSTTGQ